MTTQNATQKRIIKALAHAPEIAIKDLLQKTTDPDERDQIKRIAAALGLNIEEQPKYKTFFAGDKKNEQY